MQNTVKYRSEKKTAPLGNNTITIENRRPILTEEEHKRRRREVELQLYAVLRKYAETKR